MIIKKVLKSLLKFMPGSKARLEEQAVAKADAKVSSEKKFILQNIIRLNQLTVKDVMVPRSDVVWLDVDLPLEKNLSKIKDFSHTRYPICHKTLDNILGLIHIKEIILKVGKKVNLKKYVEKIIFASPSMLCLDLLVQMKEQKNYMAIVVDEFGGVDGLVTADRLVEEVVGQLEFSASQSDAFYEYDSASRSLLAEGRCPIEDFEKAFGKLLTDKERESDPETLAGLVLLLAGRIPNRGEVIQHATGVAFEMMEVQNRGIKRLRVYNVSALSKAKS